MSKGLGNKELQEVNGGVFNFKCDFDGNITAEWHNGDFEVILLSAVHVLLLSEINRLLMRSEEYWKKKVIGIKS